MSSSLSNDQALEVARRLNPRPDGPVRFRADGTTIARSTDLTGWGVRRIEVWECWREGNAVRVHKIDLDTGTA